ncbi:MAG: flagellar protein FliS [Planctomycetota bacterium]
MAGIQAYTATQTAFGGWTRIDMLLAIYDRAVESLQLALESETAGNEVEFNSHLIKAQKAILAIHAGLKPDEDEVAFNIARLLHFVLTCIEENKLNDAVKILANLRDGFQAIHKEATQLERNGAIPPVQQSDAYVTDV